MDIWLSGFHRKRCNNHTSHSQLCRFQGGARNSDATGDDADIRQIAVIIVVIQSVAHHKKIRNLKPDIVSFDCLEDFISFTRELGISIARCVLPNAAKPSPRK